MLILGRSSPPGPERPFGIVHPSAGPPTLRRALVAAYEPKDCFVTLATGVLGAHVGFGAWGVFYQVEDEAVDAASGAAA